MSARTTLWKGVDALGSRPFSVGLMASLILYLAMLLGFSLKSPPAVVSAIARGVPFQLAWVLVALNTLSCVVVFWRTVRSRCQPWHLRAQAHTAAGPGGPPRSLARARQWLRVRGYSVAVRPDGALHAGRGRFSALGSPVFHLSILLAAAGALLEDRGAFAGRALVNEGQAFFGEPREYLSFGDAPESRAPQLSYKVRSIRPEYFGNALFFTELVAEVETPVGPNAQVREVRLSDSVPMGDGQVTLVGFGYSLEYGLRRDDGAVLDDGVANLAIFPPGRRDALRIPGWPYTVFLELFPNFVVDEAGRPGSKGMAPGDVRLGITVVRGRSVLMRRVVRLGEGARFDGMQFVPTRLLPQGEFRIRSSPGVPVLGAAFVLMLVGLVLRLLWARRELLLGPGEAIAFEGEWPLDDAAQLRGLAAAAPEVP